MEQFLNNMKGRLSAELSELHRLEREAASEVTGEFLKAKQAIESAIAYIEAHLGKQSAV